MQARSHEPWTLLDPQDLFRLFFARDEQSLGVGVCWRSILMIFTANISSDFMHLELYYYDFLLILTSSISFDAYLKSGAIGANFGQNGANPRPAGLGQAGRPTPTTLCHQTSWRVT